MKNIQIEGRFSNENPGRSAPAEPANTEGIRPVLIRVPQALAESLQGEATRKDLSVNLLVVSILRKHSRWGQFQERLGFMPLHKSMVVQLMDRLDEQAIEEIGRNQKDQTIKDVILFSNSKYDFEAFVRWIRMRCDILGFQLLLRSDPEASSISIVINHGLGAKWSHYYKGMFELVLQELLKPADYDSLKFSLTASSFGIAITGMTGEHLQREGGS